MSVNIQTGNVVKIQSGNRVLISAPGPQGPAGEGGGGASVDFSSRLIIYASKGTAATDTRGSLSKYSADVPFATISAAITAAASGDLIVVEPGTYDERLILKDGVDIQMKGKLVYTGTGGEAISDNGSGVTCKIYGGSFRHSGASGVRDCVRLTGASNIQFINPIQLRSDNAIAVNTIGSNVMSVTVFGGEILSSDGTIDNVGSNCTVRIFNATIRSEGNYALEMDGLLIETFNCVVSSGARNAIEVASSGTVRIYGGRVTAGGTDPIANNSLSAANLAIYGAAFQHSATTVIDGSWVGNYIDVNGDTVLSAPSTVPNGGTGATTLTANNVLLGNGTSALQTVAPSTTGNVLTSNGTTWTSTAPATNNPAGSGSELQFRSSGTAFGAVTNSSVSGGAITLGAAEALGTTTAARLTLANTTAAAAGSQQISPSIVLEGQGWKTTATAASQTVRFRQNVLPVQGAANPTALWKLESEINNSGTWAERIRVNTDGRVNMGTYGINQASICVDSTYTHGLGASSTNGMELWGAGANLMSILGNGSTVMLGRDTLFAWNGSIAPAGNTALNADLILRRAAAAQLQLGSNTAVNSATAVAQILKGPNATGTTSTGGSLTIAGGTGTTAGGAVILAASATTGAPATAVTVNNNAVTTFAKPPVLPAYTVATLPATAANGMVQGAHAIVTDAVLPTYLGALTGGGAVVCPVFYNGTAWVSH